MDCDRILTDSHVHFLCFRSPQDRVKDRDRDSEKERDREGKSEREQKVEEEDEEKTQEQLEEEELMRKVMGFTQFDTTKVRFFISYSEVIKALAETPHDMDTA